MKKSIVKKILKDCEYCVKEIGRDVISANILLYVLILDPEVHGELLLNNTDMHTLHFLLNPYHVRKNTPLKISVSEEVKSILNGSENDASALDIFKGAIKQKYIKDIFTKAGYVPGNDQNTILSKYTKKIDDGVAHQEDIDKYEKITNHLGNRNVMIMGAMGSGRFEFIKSYAKYSSANFSIYYFDLFKCLKLEEDRLFGIVNGIFDELRDDYLYIPNFLKVMIWVRSLKMHNIYILLEELANRGKIITKVNKNTFDSKEFQLSKQFNFFSINIPPITIDQLYGILNSYAFAYEKFYHINIPKEEIKRIIKEANFKDTALAQPGKSLKRLMHFAMITYGQDETILQKPKDKGSFSENLSLEQHLNKSIIGQARVIEEISYEIGKINFLEGGIVKSFLFQGEIGCGKLKTATEMSKFLFGEDSLRYIDMGVYSQFPFKMKIYEKLDRLIQTMYGGIIFIDNFEELDTTQIDIFSYIKMKVKEANFEGLMAPIIIIASSRKPVTEIPNYAYIIEHFDKIVYFNKLTIRDLEKVAEIQLMKIKGIIQTDKVFSTFVISAQANPQLNALGIKKLITSMCL